MAVYEKKITETDASVRLSISTNRLDDGFFELAAGELSRDVVAFDDDDERQSWRFCLRIRRKGYRRPEISGDWLNFVRAKDVRAGDRVWFSKENYYDQATGRETMAYRVGVVKRSIRVFGASLREGER